MAYPAGFTTWTVADAINKARNLTGTPGADQLSDDQLLGYYQQVYIYVMPFELKEQIELQYLNFKTTPGIDTYSFPGGYFTSQPGAYADGFPLIFYQDPDIYQQDWPQQYAVDNIAGGDGVTATFSGGLQNPPIVTGTLFISSVDNNDVTWIASDTPILNAFPNPTVDGPTGTLSGATPNGAITGTINYFTGAYSITYPADAIPSSTATIYAKYQAYLGNRPQGVLFFNNQFQLRPVPDQVYAIQMQGYIQPTLASLTSQPLQAEWGAYLAYAMALEIFSDRGDMENYERYFPVFKRYENVALGRTIQQLTSEHSVPRF